MPGIIVGVDGSGHSRRVLEVAVQEAAVRHAALTVLTVHQATVGYFGGVAPSGRDADLTGQAQAAAQAGADQILGELDGPPPESVTVKAVNGFPIEELLNASKEADMLVLGSHGMGGFSRILMGSTAEQVVRHAHCPVLIVPPDYRG